MSDSLMDKAREIISILDSIPEVNHCAVYGSILNGTCDELSDFDIEIDVSGTDNGQFMLGLPDILRKKLPICYYDYAPSLIPDMYVVSLAIDENDPFRIVDIKCSADPHITTVTKAQAATLNDKFTHMLKLWTINLKHFVRGADCLGDIVRMAQKIETGGTYTKNEAELLEDTLRWLVRNAGDEFSVFVKSCQNKFDELIKHI